MARTRVGLPEPEPQTEPLIETPPEDEVNPSGIRKLRVKWGSEHIQPIQYNGFHIGDLEIEIEVSPNETPEECYDRAWSWLERMVAKQYEAKLQGFIGRVTNAAKSMRPTR